MIGTSGFFLGTFKKHKVLIKNLVFTICLIVLIFQFKWSFGELIDLVDGNQPYIQINPYQEPLVPEWGQMVPGVVPTKVPVGTDRTEQSGFYVTTDTLKIYTYKLFQTILLLFGIFMCIIFMATNNKGFSLIELNGEKEE